MLHLFGAKDGSLHIHSLFCLHSHPKIFLAEVYREKKYSEDTGVYTPPLISWGRTAKSFC